MLYNHAHVVLTQVKRIWSGPSPESGPLDPSAWTLQHLILPKVLPYFAHWSTA